MRSQACLIVAILLLSSAAGRADEAAEAVDAFNSLYGEEYKRVTATPSPADDVALAAQLLDAAKTVANQAALLAVLCDKTCELGAKDPSGHATALEALDLLAARAPEKKTDCLAKRVAIYQRQYAAAPARSDAKTKAGEALAEAQADLSRALMAKGDADGAVAAMRQAFSAASAVGSASKAPLQAELAAALTRQIVARQAAALKEKLAADPSDADSRKELVRLLLVEFDNPAEAAKYVDASIDEPTRRYVPAAAKPLEEAPELACLELAKWFQDLAGRTPTPFGKAAVLWRARTYYERYLDLHTTADMAQAAATVALAKVTEAVDALGPAGKRPAAAPPWTDGLKQFDPAKTYGDWELREGVLRLLRKGAPAKIGIPCPLEGSYELEVCFVPRQEETGQYQSVAVILPVGQTSCALQFCARGDSQFGGLEYVRGKNVIDTEASARSAALVYDQENTATIKVVRTGEDVEIAVTANGKPYLNWKGPAAVLTNPSWRLPDARCPGVGAYGCLVDFKRVRIRPLPPDYKLPAAPAAPAAAARGDS